jgi:hypothetical protein
LSGGPADLSGQVRHSNEFVRFMIIETFSFIFETKQFFIFYYFVKKTSKVEQIELFVQITFLRFWLG